MSEDKKFLEVKNLKVEYTSEGKIVHAVNGVTFHLDRGRTVGLVGETGAGKTSIAKAILRILPNPGGKISDGEVYLEGEDILKRSERGMRTSWKKNIYDIPGSNDKSESGKKSCRPNRRGNKNT